MGACACPACASRSLDIWGLGAVLCEVFTGKPPWGPDATDEDVTTLAGLSVSLEQLWNECACGAATAMGGRGGSGAWLVSWRRWPGRCCGGAG